MRWILVFLAALVSIGWLAPLYFSFDCLITWCEHEGAGTHGQHSFPYLSAARQAFAVAALWAGVVGFGWAMALGRKCCSTAKIC
jgi:hypothetical protein